MSYWEPVRETGTRPALTEHDGKYLYLKSYLLMRTVIGFIGIFLPTVLLLGDIVFLKGSPLPRGSLSAYYHSGMRDLFVGSLCVTALFLITYKVFEKNLDNTLSLIAGVAVLGVAWFPTGRPAGSTSPATPLQEKLGESTVMTIHFICAGIFIGSLAVMSYLFGLREGERPPQPGKRPPGFWRWFHWSCAIAIVAAVVFVALTKLLDWFDSYSLLIGETVAVLAFGVSWLMKGLELDILRAPTEPGRSEPDPPDPDPSEPVTSAR
jgi:hypothetical protein